MSSLKLTTHTKQSTYKVLTVADIYCASRSLYGLAKDKQAPQFFAKTLENGVPIFAVGLTSLSVCLGFLNATKSSATVFGYFVSLVTVFAVLNWTAILISHISFRRALKAQGISLSDLPYTGFLQPYGTYYALFVSILVVIFNGTCSFIFVRFLVLKKRDPGYDAFIPHFKASTFILKYLGIIIFVLNVVWWKIMKGTEKIQSSRVDLSTGRREFERHEDTA